MTHVGAAGVDRRGPDGRGVTWSRNLSRGAQFRRSRRRYRRRVECQTDFGRADPEKDFGRADLEKGECLLEKHSRGQRIDTGVVQTADTGVTRVCSEKYR